MQTVNRKGTANLRGKRRPNLSISHSHTAKEKFGGEAVAPYLEQLHGSVQEVVSKQPRAGHLPAGRTKVKKQNALRRAPALGKLAHEALRDVRALDCALVVPHQRRKRGRGRRAHGRGADVEELEAERDELLPDLGAAEVELRRKGGIGGVRGRGERKNL